ncbi:MAG: carboxylesterase/lipase family protein [Eubacterium sp.]|nr:carboxylesterase/lipase family protein [Eubacterium sp.]
MTNQELKDSYGVNKLIGGSYDQSLAAECINGTFVGRRTDDGILVFKGIPYAKPPVGPLRWKKPRLAGKDNGVYEAYYNGKTPIQTEWPSERASYYPQGEDCLYLNVWVNTAYRGFDKTVMVFIHGGSYGWGGTADPLYDGANFVRHNPDIVLITVGYRTGLMGFVDFSEVPGGENFPDAPNLGLWDQIAALRWVKKNVRAFGGDPDSVTVFGESAGGGSVSLLPITPAAKGLFRRVIAESGSVALTFSKEECQTFTKKLLETSGARTMDDLMAMSEADLMKYNGPINEFNCFPQRDGVLIPEDPYQAYLNGETANIDIMMGTNANELNYWVGELGGIVPFRLGMPVMFENSVKGMFPGDQLRAKRFVTSGKQHPLWRIVEFSNEVLFRLPMIRQAEGHARRGGRVYLYYWKKPSTIPYRGACHAVELAYVFGNTRETIYTGEPVNEELARLTMSMWANFARTGDPSAGGLKWPEYRDRRSTMVINDRCHVERDIKKEQRKLLSPILKYQLNGSYADMDYHVPFVTGTLIGGAAALSVLAAGTVLLIRHPWT